MEGSNAVAVTETTDIALVLSQDFLNIQATIKCRLTLKRIRDIMITYRQMLRTDKYSQHSLIIRQNWFLFLVFVNSKLVEFSFPK